MTNVPNVAATALSGFGEPLNKPTKTRKPKQEPEKTSGDNATPADDSSD